MTTIMTPDRTLSTVGTDVDGRNIPLGPAPTAVRYPQAARAFYEPQQRTWTNATQEDKSEAICADCSAKLGALRLFCVSSRENWSVFFCILREALQLHG